MSTQCACDLDLPLLCVFCALYVMLTWRNLFCALLASRYVQPWFLTWSLWTDFKVGSRELIFFFFFFFFWWSGGLWNWNFVKFHFEAKLNFWSWKLQCFLQILFQFWSEKCNILLKKGSRGLDYISTGGLENWHVPQLGGPCKLQKRLEKGVFRAARIYTTSQCPLSNGFETKPIEVLSFIWILLFSPLKSSIS